MKRIDKLPAPPKRPGNGHKGTFGKVLIIAGSRGMSGAACLSGTSALRGGSGLVYVAGPEGIVPIVAGYEPSYLTMPLNDDEQGRIDGSALATLLDRAAGMDAVAIGPGLGQSVDLQLLVTELYRSVEQPMVIDADALNLLAKRQELISHHAGPRVLTPHVGEFGRLTGQDIATIQSDRETHATKFASDHGITLVLKGQDTIITDGKRLAVNETGNSGMATGGTGDVLTGLITSLVGQGMPAFEAAQYGAYLHGLAGDLAADALSHRGMMASDLVDFIAEAWLTIEDDE